MKQSKRNYACACKCIYKYKCTKLETCLRSYDSGNYSKWNAKFSYDACMIFNICIRLLIDLSAILIPLVPLKIDYSQQRDRGKERKTCIYERHIYYIKWEVISRDMWNVPHFVDW